MGTHLISAANTTQSGRVVICSAPDDAPIAAELSACLRRAGLGPLLLHRTLVRILPSDGVGESPYILVVHSAVAQATLDAPPWPAEQQDAIVVLVRTDDSPAPKWLTGAASLEVNLKHQGLDRLVQFFSREAAPERGLSDIPREGSAGLSLATLSRRELRLLACHCLDEVALREFLFDVDIPQERLRGATLSAQVLDLLQFVITEGALEQFIDWLADARSRCVAAQLEVLRSQKRWASPLASRKPAPPGPQNPARTKIFISYHRSDLRWLTRVKVHLKTQERAGLIDSWDETQLLAGMNRRSAVAQAIALSRTGVLLLSADFLASDYIANEELPALLDAAAADGMQILPLWVRPCLVPESLSVYQPFTPPSRTLLDLSEAEVERVCLSLTKLLVDHK